MGEVRLARRSGDDVSAFGHGPEATTSRRGSVPPPRPQALRARTGRAAGIALALAALTACGPARPAEGETNGVTYAPDGPLRLALETPIRSLDPADAGDAVSRRITAQIFDTLLEWDLDGASGEPRLHPEILRELPEVASDGLTWTLHLRSGADARRFAADTCLEGQARPVRASDVAATLLRLDPARHPAWPLLAGRIVGLDGAARTDVAGVLADDAAHTLTLRLTRPQPELAAILASPMLAIAPRECLAYYDGRDPAHPPFARHPVGSGPYVLDHLRSELPRAAVLQRSPEAPASDRLTELGCPQVPGAAELAWTHFSDPEPALRSFQAGELAALAPGQAQFAELVADPITGRLHPGAAAPGTSLHRVPALATTLLVFRMTDPELGSSADPVLDAEHRALRQAVALAFDAVRYHRVIRNDAWAVPRARIVPRGLGGAHDHEALHRFAPPAADLEQARRILAAAGLHGPRRLRYWTDVGEGAQQEAVILRDALRPLDIELEITARTNYLHEILGGRGDAQLYSLRFDADYLEASSFLAPFTCAAADNYSGFCDPAYDAAYAAYAALPAGPARDLAAAGLERRLGEAVPVRPIDQPEAWYLVQPWLQGVQRHPLAGLRIELLCPRGRPLAP